MEIAFHSSKTAAIRGGCQSETREDFPEDDKVQTFWEMPKNTKEDMDKVLNRTKPTKPLPTYQTVGGSKLWEER